MLRFVPDQLKNKKMCKNAVKKLLLVIRYISDWYKTQEMCEVILENGTALIATRIKKCVIKLIQLF